ncbi:response regulator [Belnapia sp. T6]|uniref:Response regulator n=1 Tax=Belnapia mucosa TaxID=2804532 RepID=A0ABS1VCZ6_9PROT|nr:response regulator [Belnapia mucosa]MBL6459572.1 response regulator [Belnapia mucosa]
MRVLVVEDEPLIRMLVCELLEDEEYTCTQAADAAEALALLDRGLCRPDIMVTDFNLGPGLNGQALAGQALRRLPQLAITFITGNSRAFDEYPLRSWERLVVKPFLDTDLLHAISSLRLGHDHGRPVSSLSPRLQTEPVAMR